MISNCGHDENNKYHGGSAGDQTGTEYRVIKWYNRPWNYVLRPKSRTVGNKLAQIARQAAENNNIGYDQYQRLTYFDALSKADWNPSKITTKCETDCTASTAANVIATGYQLGIKPLEEVSPKLYSGNIRKGLMATGEFETLTASKYLTSDKYLLPGDILLYENHHAAINLSNGSSNDLPSSSSSSPSAKPSISETAKNVVNGKYGNGQDRIDKLKALGYTDAEIKEIQAKVNELVKPASKPATTTKPASKPKPTPKPSPASHFKVGSTYTTQVGDLNVRTGAGTGYRKKSRSELTADGRKHADSEGQFKKGTRVTCKAVKSVGSQVWIQTPSGWLCAYNGSKYYVY